MILLLDNGFYSWLSKACGRLFSWRFRWVLIVSCFVGFVMMLPGLGFVFEVAGFDVKMVMLCCCFEVYFGGLT